MNNNISLILQISLLRFGINITLFLCEKKFILIAFISLKHIKKGICVLNIVHDLIVKYLL